MISIMLTLGISLSILSVSEPIIPSQIEIIVNFDQPVIKVLEINDEIIALTAWHNSSNSMNPWDINCFISVSKTNGSIIKKVCEKWMYKIKSAFFDNQVIYAFTKDGNLIDIDSTNFTQIRTRQFPQYTGQENVLWGTEGLYVCKFPNSSDPKGHLLVLDKSTLGLINDISSICVLQ